jgi:hypothetical protein
MTKATTDFYEIVHSPDDEAECGLGWYAYTINKEGSMAEESGLLKTRQHARAWARERGGRRELGGAQ